MKMKRKGVLTILSVTFGLFLITNGLANQEKAQHKFPINQNQLVLLKPDFCFSNVSHYNEIKCKDPIFVITFLLHNKGSTDFLPNPQCELYLELRRAKDKEVIHWLYFPMNYKIEKSKFRRMNFTINHADIKKKDVLKTARRIKLQLFADVTHKLSELDETNNEYKTDNITHFCLQKVNVPLKKKYPPLQARTKKVIKKPDVVALQMIKQIVPFYDDCQLIFYMKGNFFGQTQGTRIIRMKSHTKMYTPQILKWTPTQIDCLLKGNFELGRKYKVYLWDTASHKIVSNQYKWIVKTKLNPLHQGFIPGQIIAVSGCLLGHAQGARKLIIGKHEAQVTQWTCEDLVFKVPNLLPTGIYPLYLREGRLILSNKIKIQIL